MKEGFVGRGARRLHYVQWGEGAQLIICFHGYSNDAGIYSKLAQYLPSNYRLVSIDLPFHGKSAWDGQLPIGKQELIEIVQEIRNGSSDKFFLSGFSLGGRVALTIIEQMPQQIAAAYLAAPDGLVANPTYQFVTKNPLGKTLFRRMIQDPSRHLKLLDWLQKKGWINESKQQFAAYFLSSKYSREFLGKAWPAVQDLIPSIPRVRASIESYKIPVHLFMGKWDKVIPPKNAISFAKDAANVHVYILDKGHRVLDDETCRKIVKMLPA